MTDTEHPPARSPLVSFLLARIDEDEQIARAAFTGPWRYNPRKQWEAPVTFGQHQAPAEEYIAAGPLDNPTCIAVTGHADDSQSMADAAHIARHDPARVLADCAAKRAVVTLLRQYEAAIRQESAGAQPGDPLPRNLYAARDALEEAVRLLAQPHSAHPGFDPAWRLDQS